MKIIPLVVLAIGGYILYQFVTPLFDDSRETFSLGRPMNATVIVSDATYPFSFDAGLSVAEALRRAGFHFVDRDEIYPAADTLLLPGMNILWHPARSIKILVEGDEKAISAFVSTSEEIIAEAGIALDEDDIVVPARGVTVSDGMKIVITRVEIREETKETKIPFVMNSEEDSELSWRKKIVKQKGENGTKTTTYRVSYHNGKEVNRKTLSVEVTKEPVAEIVTQGTYVKTGKAHRGAASWYAWTGTMAAANPWLPKGSYVKVTNMDNGKSVIVVINDRGPFVPGRIIDLDKVAFEKIASIGAGVINVKMEEIVN
jgi:rare lipoprotein A (peptidoglycan hydrolase)